MALALSRMRKNANDGQTDFSAEETERRAFVAAELQADKKRWPPWPTAAAYRARAATTATTATVATAATAATAAITATTTATTATATATAEVQEKGDDASGAAPGAVSDEWW